MGELLPSIKRCAEALLTMFRLGGELRTPRETSVSELLENFMGVDECIWPTWPFDDVAELDWSAAIP